MTIIDRTISAAKKLVAHFCHSVVGSEALKKRQQQMGVEQKRLIQSCVSSCYEMLSRLLEMRWPISAVLSDDSVTKRSEHYLDLKSEQWAIAEEQVTVLRPLQIATTFIQYENNTSLSCVLPVIHVLDLSLQPSTDDSSAVWEKVRLELRSRWSLDCLDSTSTRQTIEIS